MTRSDLLLKVVHSWINCGLARQSRGEKTTRTSIVDQLGLLVGRAITEVAITDQRHFYNSVSSSSFEPSKTHHVNAKFGA